MRIEYHGPHDGVEVPLADGRVIEVMRGQSAEFPEEVAKNLLEQSTWHEAAPATEPTTKTKKAAKAEESEL